MSASDIVVRALAGIAGIGLISAGAAVNVMHAGPENTDVVVVTCAIAVALAIGSIVVGWGLRNRAWLPVGIVVVGLAAGEAAAGLWTVTRLMESQESREAPRHAAQSTRTTAMDRVGAAEAAVAALATSPRMTAAEAALQAAQTASLTKSAEAGCKAGCIATLEKSRIESAAELAAARADLEARRRSAESELATARRALVSLPPAPSATATADAFGMSPLMHKLMMAVLGALSLNVGGAGFLAVAAHASVRRPGAADHATVSTATIEVLAPLPSMPMPTAGPEHMDPRPRASMRRSSYPRDYGMLPTVRLRSLASTALILTASAKRRSP